MSIDTPGQETGTQGIKHESVQYAVKTCAPGDLSEMEIATCVEIIKAGGAVDVSLAKVRGAEVLAVALKGDQIVGMGAIKRINTDYATKVAARSGFEFPHDTPELGYVAIDEKHRGKKLSKQIVEALLAASQTALYSTTYSDQMKKTLVAAEFALCGNEWPSRQESTKSLSLFLRAGKPVRNEGLSRQQK